MKWLLLVALVVLLLGPLRRWVGRHWAFLLSVVAGAVFGSIAGAFMVTKLEAPPITSLFSALICAIAAGRSGPSLLREIEKDGRDESSSRRH